MAPCLIVISGRQMGQVFRLNEREATLGRDDDATFCIRDASISRRHAVVLRDKQARCHIRDLDSTNGTFVNGKRVQEAELSAGDRIQIGRSTLLKLEYHGSVEKEFHAKLYDAGTRDPLTGLFNRGYLDQHLEADFRLAERHGEAMSVLVIDVDRFKSINDAHGHLAGDAVLRTLAHLLIGRLRREDVLARYGGEEFVAVLRHTDAAGARRLADAMRELVEGGVYPYKGTPLKVSVSIGVATFDPATPYASHAELLQAADEAMYRAKNNGRNRIEAASGVG